MLSIQKFGCILIAALICSAAFAQNIIVSGNITDASTGEPVPYATVQVKGTTKGVSSDNEGHYSSQFSMTPNSSSHPSDTNHLK